METRWNEISRIKQTLPLCIKSIILFSNKCQWQPTIILKPGSWVDEPRDYLLIVNSSINYIDESCIRTRILMSTNESQQAQAQK